MMSDPSEFVCCPSCGDAPPVIRLGPAGRYGKPDSPNFKCLACGTRFRVKGGMTWSESMGSLP